MAGGAAWSSRIHTAELPREILILADLWRRPPAVKIGRGANYGAIKGREAGGSGEKTGLPPPLRRRALPPGGAEPSPARASPRAALTAAPGGQRQ